MQSLGVSQIYLLKFYLVVFPSNLMIGSSLIISCRSLLILSKFRSAKRTCLVWTRTFFSKEHSRLPIKKTRAENLIVLEASSLETILTKKKTLKTNSLTLPRKNKKAKKFLSVKETLQMNSIFWLKRKLEFFLLCLSGTVVVVLVNVFYISNYFDFLVNILSLLILWNLRFSQITCIINAVFILI